MMTSGCCPTAKLAKPAAPLLTRMRVGWSRATAYARSAVSRGVSSKKAPAEVRAARWQSCHGSIDRPPCANRAYERHAGFFYCSACGCGDIISARLSAVACSPDQPCADHEYDKLDYPYLECPIGAPGFSNAKVTHGQP